MQCDFQCERCFRNEGVAWEIPRKWICGGLNLLRKVLRLNSAEIRYEQVAGFSKALILKISVVGLYVMCLLGSARSEIPRAASSPFNGKVVPSNLKNSE